MINVLLAYNDCDRFWTTGSYLKRLLAQDPQYRVVAHVRIPEDIGLLACRDLNIDLAFIPDCGTWYKFHHHNRDIKEQNIKTAIWLSDLHRSDWANWRLQSISEFRFDHVFVCQKPFIQMIRERGYAEHQVSWLPHAVDPTLFVPMPQIPKLYNVGFVGYMNDRREQYSNILREMVNFKAFHTRWELDAARCINECEVGWNNSVTDLDFANMRVFETLACQVPLLTNCIRANHAGLLDLYEEDKHLMIYENEEEMKEKIVRLLANRDLRENLANEGYKHTLIHHSYKNRLNTLLNIMGFPLLV